MPLYEENKYKIVPELYVEKYSEEKKKEEERRFKTELNQSKASDAY